jgi:hypothetical protein
MKVIAFYEQQNICLERTYWSFSRTWLYHSKKDAISEGIARAGCIEDKLTNYGSYFERESG